MGCGPGPPPALAPVLIRPPRYCDEDCDCSCGWADGFGEVAEDTEDESYDLVEGFGDRAWY